MNSATTIIGLLVNNKRGMPSQHLPLFGKGREGIKEALRPTTLYLAR